MKKMALAALTLMATACTDASATASTPTWNLPDIHAVTIDWSTCSTDLVGTTALVLGDRLRCGQMSVPRDHRHPQAGQMQVAIVRVAAADPARRRGALFFNPGGPGETPMESLPTLARYWNDAHAGHPVHGTKRELSDVFDLVGVVPRGLKGGTTFTCTSEHLATDYQDIVADRSEANLRTMDMFMRAIASACRRNPLYRFINTEQTVYDMEAARLSLGEPRLNFFGVSYGSWIGSWYAASFPQHVGRMFLDSSMDWTSDWNTNVERLKSTAHAEFVRLVAEPAANDRFRYRFGADVAAVMTQFDHLTNEVRQGWGGLWKTPESLLAARGMSDITRVEPGMTLPTLLARIGSHRFHSEPTVNHAARLEATEHAWRVMPIVYVPETFRLDERDSVLFAVMCNDMPYLGDAAYHRAKIASLAAQFPSIDGRGLEYHCVYWDGAHATRPPLSRMAAAGGILMVQAEHDPVTPLLSAIASLDATPTARLIIADNFESHGVFGFTDSACIEALVGNYLLRGTLPVERTSHCEARPADTGSSGFSDPPQAAALRKELSAVHSQFARQPPFVSGMNGREPGQGR
ncbi:MAG TPA: alpha/beta fold hydrolase [Luteibacter sp.]|uniref:alpha/beta fold hydrolase n=1 Tax=Luteibacter sp. TaxID=1886636 RepID=UPI002C7E4B66|nr:alpha/beta fold hydrolase [Luteibacter sp.]HVI56724.1 alpha/beta fold hydrolase [Luteibacter sp.]